MGRRTLDRGTRLERYEAWSSVPVFGFALLFLVGLIEVVSSDGSTEGGTWMIAIAWGALVIDLVVRWLLSDDRRAFPRKHWFEIVAIAIPLFRIGMVFYVFVRLARRRGRMAQRIQVYAAYLTVLVIVFGALLVLAAERNYPGSNITTYGEAVWWAVVTVATVGYGDYVPVSPEGRSIAVVMLFNGVALISVVTASIAARFVADPDAGERAVTLDELDERLERIEAALAALTAAGGTDPDGPADPSSPGGTPA